MTSKVATSSTVAGGPGTLRLYVAYVSQSVRAQMQYRLSFFLLMFGNFVTTTVEILGVWALFERFGSLGQWTFAQVAFLYGMVSCVFALSEMLVRGFDVFGTEFVKTGNFDRVLVRPRSTVLQLVGYELHLRNLGRFLQGAAVFAWAVWMLPIDWHVGKVALVGYTVVCGVLFFCALFIFQATLAFLTTESLEIINTMTYGGVETAQYPLAIYDRWFRRFFTFVVPLGCISYFPAVAIFGIEDPLGSPFWLQVSAPTAGLVFFGLSLVAWFVGIRHYTSTGS